MTYIELINNFWQEFGNKGMQPNDVLLYFYLLDHCNRISWQNPFPITNKNLIMMLEISEHSLINSRQRLMERGLIDFLKGQTRKSAPVYFIVGVAYNGDCCKFCSNLEEIRKKFGSNTEAYNKDYKTKDKETPPKGGVKKVEGEPTLFSNGETENPRPKKGRSIVPEPPTLEEVRAFFCDSEFSTEIANPQLEAEKFFYYFESLNWRTSGRRIPNWQARAKVWILDSKSKNEQPNTDRAGIREAEKQQRDDEFAKHIAAQLSGQLADDSETADI